MKIFKTATLIEKLLFLLFIIFTTANPVQAIEPVRITANMQSVSLGKHVEILEDKSGRITIEDILSGHYEKDFYPHNKANINLGLSNSAYWIRFAVQFDNLKNNPDTDLFLLNLDAQYIFHADLYTPIENKNSGQAKIQIQRGGTLKPLGKYELVYSNVIYNLPEPGKGPSLLYLRVESKSPFFIPIKIERRDVLEQRLLYQLLLFGIFYGIMTGLFFYNLFLYLFLKEKDRLFYLLYLLTITLYFSAVNRLTTEFLFRNNPVVSTLWTLAFLGISSAFAMLFAKNFLSTRRLMPKINLVINLLICISLGLSASVFIIDYMIVMNFYTILGLLVPLTLIITGIAAFMKGNRNARFYIWASFIFLIGTIIFSLTFQGYLPYNIFTFYNFQIANAIEAILLSIALADRINSMNSDLKNLNSDLKDALEVAHLGFHDHLTGLYNHRFYEEELKRLDRKRNLPLTLLVTDVNSLKLTNDVFGHHTGDLLLKKAADLLKTECRSDDIIARTGGDEFVIILPATDSITADAIVRRIKNRMGNEMVDVIPLSISFGHATKTSDTQSTGDIYREAEDLMYQDKLTNGNSIKLQVVDSIIRTLFTRHPYEERHAFMVSRLCTDTGRAMNLRDDEIRELEKLGLMHDVGKIAVSCKSLNSGESLDTTDKNEIIRHCEAGYRILSSVAEYAKLAGNVLSIHERWDGTGSPRGIKGDEIPLHSRILAIADTYASLVEHGSYNGKLTPEQAEKKLRMCSGVQLDPEICKLFITKVLGLPEY